LEEKIMTSPLFTLEEVTDPVAIARSQDQNDQHRRNSEWLQAHWADLLPQALGRFVAVAGQEAFLADTPETAWAWVAAAHPEDRGAFVRYLRPAQGPRIYAHRG
jgi:hypothetical protein